VAEFCTCGAELPPEARFCHKCGKPQREEAIVEAEEQAPERPPAPAAAPPGIDFRNALAVRVGFVSGLLANLAILLPYLFVAFPLWMLGAGFVGVRLYTRRSGQRLTVGGGARLGWIAGVLAFAIFTVFFTINFLVAYSSGLFTDRRRLSQIPFVQGNVDEVVALMQDPAALALHLVISIVVLFVLFAGLSVAGGALGAKALRRS
jgi:hypothetical protein